MEQEKMNILKIIKKPNRVSLICCLTICCLLLLIGTFSTHTWILEADSLGYDHNCSPSPPTSSVSPVFSFNSIHFQIHDPIHIDDPSDFGVYGFPGSGSEADPFIISGYSISNPSGHGIEIQNITSYFTICNNVLNGKGGPDWGSGIFLMNVSHGTIENNLICECRSGIAIFVSDNTQILNNSITCNVGFAFGINPGSDHSTIKFNNIVANRVYPGVRPSQAYDVGFNNTISHNYWDDWISPDLDHDLIVDLPYSMDNSTDSYPVISPWDHPHSFVTPSLISPLAGEFLNGLVEIHWLPSNVTSNQLVTYTVYFSSDSGMTWRLLVPDLNATSYNWDTNLVVDGTDYKLRVVANCSLGIVFEGISNARFTIFNSGAPPYILFPGSGALLMGKVKIEWLPSMFLPDLSLTYSVYYSDDNGSSWILLVSDLSSYEFVWDTTSVSDGSNYRIKIEEIYSNGLSSFAISDGTFTIDNMSSLITTIILPIPVAIVSLGLLFWINKRVYRIIEEKMTINNEL
ncbi:MAG: right-handed parallel beta-helix repeat-containing protein [Candidatus Hodarchaeales archaeon]